MRQLKFHEKKLLKKVDFLKWKTDDNAREIQVGTCSRASGCASACGWYCFSLFLSTPSPPPHTHHVCTMFVPFGPLHSQVMRRYHIQNRDDYKKYNKICGMITKLTCILKQLDAQDTARIEMTDQLLDK